ncbi:MAG: small subunit ribosomal protein S5 [Alteromonas naphthalenivorans]|jgi:small subunit ribosomal protein S5
MRNKIMAERTRKESAKDQTTMVDNVIKVRRVTKVTKGGKRFGFSALVVTGDQGGRIGIGQGKSREVAAAITKATNRARKNLIEVSLRGSTLPYNVLGRHGASRVLIRSASKGTGVIAGGAVRSVMEALGVKDVLAKSLGSENPTNVVKATLNALAQLRGLKRIAQLRGRSVEQIIKGSHE